MFRCGILSYGCSSAAGPTKGDFWNSLRLGVDHSRPISGFLSGVCAWPDREALKERSPESTLDLLVRHLLLAWQDCLGGLDFLPRRLGVILASTKGCVDDWVWNERPDLSRDPLVPVLERFLIAAEINPIETICVSNACTSSLTAVLLGREWLRQDRVDHVLVLAVDHAGKFIHKGFETLKVVTPSVSRPFGNGRDGLCLGDAAAAILLGQEGGLAEIESIASDTEGFAVTRPSQSGASLRRACLAVGVPDILPDLIIAHGTGTIVNDQIEDQVFTSLFGEHKIPVTGTKWCTGHTLGASAAMDMIAACETLRRQVVFRLANTDEVDPLFHAHYLSAREPLPEHFRAERILISSLGFGGVHAAAIIKKTGKSPIMEASE